MDERETMMNRRIALELNKVRDLRYGENPHQNSSLYDVNCKGFPVNVSQGKELSYTNLLDLDAAWRMVNLFEEPCAVIVKHTNPCGVATGSLTCEAYVRARDADPVSAFGGIVALNRPLDRATAEAIISTFVECVIAPHVEELAREVIGLKPNMRVATCGDKKFGVEYRSVFGCLLAQEPDDVAEAASKWPTDGLEVVTKRHPTSEEWKALRFAWLVCAAVKSNAVVLATEDRTVGIGGGQSNRVASAKISRGLLNVDLDALAKELEDNEGAGRLVSIELPRYPGCVAASDAFFPFRDGLDQVAAAGATAVVQPGGSVRDGEVIAAANEHGMAMVFTKRRHFRH